MDRDTLADLLRRHRRTLPEAPGEQIDFDGASVTRHWDRGVHLRTAFDSEDALCRYLLARDLLRAPEPAAAPQPVPDAIPPGWCATETETSGPPMSAAFDVTAPAAAGGPAVAWSAVVGPLSRVAARSGGVVVLHDAGSLLAHGFDGAAHATAVDVATGRRRWSVPLLTRSARPVIAVAGDVVLLGLADELLGIDAATGATRFRRPAPVPPPAAPRARRGTPPTETAPWQLLACDGGVAVLGSVGTGATPEGSRLAGVDLADGSTRWAHEATTWPRGPVLLQAVADGATVRVQRLGVTDGVLRTVLECPAPQGFEAPAPQRRGLLRRSPPDERLAIAAEALGEPGLVLARAERRHGEQRSITRAVLAPGRDAPLAAGLPVEWGRGPTWAATLVDEHRCTVTTGGTTSLLDATGTVRWQRQAVMRTLAAGTDGALVVRRAHTAFVGDDGRDRWEQPGQARWVRGDEAWIARRLEGDPPRVALSAIDLATGKPRWTTPFGGRAVAVGATALTDWRADDDHLLDLVDGRLTAWRAGG